MERYKAKREVIIRGTSGIWLGTSKMLKRIAGARYPQLLRKRLIH